jgi:hypothetical protein
MGKTYSTHTFGNEYIDELSDELTSLIAEKPLGLHVDERDTSIFSDAEHRIRSRFE